MLRIPNEILKANLEQTLVILDNVSMKFLDHAKLCGSYSGNQDIENLLSSDRLNQFKAIVKAIRCPLHDVDLSLASLINLDDSIEEQARLTLSWITLGAIVEATMKIWLAVYYADYLGTAWRVWSIDEATVSCEIKSKIDELYIAGKLNNGQNESLKSIFDNALIKHRDVPDLDMIDFVEMLKFYKKQARWDRDTVDFIDNIRRYRNCIHAFKPRSIGNWKELLEALHFTCAFFLELKSYMPDCSDAIAAEEEMRNIYESEVEEFYCEP